MGQAELSTLSDYLYGGIYQRSCRFANIDRFVARVGRHLDLRLPTDAAGAARIFSDFCDDLETHNIVHDDHSAENILVARDLRRINTADFSRIADTEEVTARLDRYSPAIQQRLARAGLDVGNSPLRIVDEFHEPFNKFGWSAFAPDREDEENFGVPCGVYFLRDRLRPFYSEALFAHEVVHTVTGGVDPEIYAMGLEEGIAEVVGTCYGGLAVLPPETIRNILVYGRHGVERPKLWSIYLDHIRQAHLLFNEFGIDGLVSLINQGRAAIHEAENLIVAGEHRKISLPRGAFDEQTRDLLDFVCCAYPPSHLFSPLECLLAVNVRSGRKLSDICADSRVDAEVGVPVLERLGGASALFIQVGDRIGYSNTERYLNIERNSDVAVLRYLPSETPG